MGGGDRRLIFELTSALGRNKTHFRPISRHVLNVCSYVVGGRKRGAQLKATERGSKIQKVALRVQKMMLGDFLREFVTFFVFSSLRLDWVPHRKSNSS